MQIKSLERTLTFRACVQMPSNSYSTRTAEKHSPNVKMNVFHVERHWRFEHRKAVQTAVTIIQTNFSHRLWSNSGLRELDNFVWQVNTSLQRSFLGMGLGWWFIPVMRVLLILVQPLCNVLVLVIGTWLQHLVMWPRVLVMWLDVCGCLIGWRWFALDKR